MKAISIKQPWAGLIALGEKTIDVRSPSFRYNYRGDLVVCASKSIDWEAYGHWQAKRGSRLDAICSLVGKAIAIVALTNIRPLRPEDKAGALCPCNHEGVALVLTGPRLIAPEPVTGALGIFDLPEDFWPVKKGGGRYVP